MAEGIRILIRLDLDKAIFFLTYYPDNEFLVTVFPNKL